MAIRNMVPFGRNRAPARERATERAPQRPVNQLQRRMEGLMEDFFDEFFGGGPLSELGDDLEADLIPSVDVREKGKEVQVRAELPGVEENDVDVNLDGRTLTISGEKQSEHEQGEGEERQSESVYGYFSRQVQLPADVDDSNAEAKFKNGVLTIKLPKVSPQQSEGRRIEIKS